MDPNAIAEYGLKAHVSLEQLADQHWRLNNLYTIMGLTPGGTVQKMIFKMNETQDHFYHEMWYRNVVLKSRQAHGFTTLICVYMLDTALFNSNIRCCVIAHDDDDTNAYFRDKFKFPYDNLHAIFRAARPAKTDRKQELLFENNSAARVTSSGRSGTNDIVLASEFGKTSVMRPDRATEIITGSFETVPQGGMIFIESTAYGPYGAFFDICKRAQDMDLAGKELSKEDFKFFFFPWHKGAKNTISDHSKVTIHERMATYLNGLKGKHRIDLTAGQKAWYVKKEETLEGNMKREHPSTPDEAFEQNLEGTYYSLQFRFLRENRRLTAVPYFDGVLVNTWWDLGYGDKTTIWFTQNIGREIHCIYYYEMAGEGLAHYADKLKERGYRYGRHVAPHDVVKGELGPGKTLIDQAAALGIDFEVGRKMETTEQHRIEPVRQILSICWFDEVGCAQGIKALEAYRKEWDDRMGRYKDTPLHDWASDGADSFALMAHNHEISGQKGRSPRREVRQTQKGRPAFFR